MTTPPVQLRPITDAEFPGWKDRTATSYAAAIGPARGLTKADALKAAYEETNKLLPDGPATEQHLLWFALADDETVGSLWIRIGPRIAFIYSIEVDSTQRGKGYGRAIMLAGEEECRRLGHQYLDLNVFGDNATAIGLYDSLGYAVVSQQMRKEL
ncbi:GNAT family N-acetyltransferase [Kribbella sp. NPDC000426]|uniref:GNAT family N-acetyltransferase n=1 Tax=Kribbella sp. NPDC000426 TaxID=3154255 RepID=UPI00331CEDE7